MLAGIFHQGSGLGNQLFRYITTRTLAEHKGCSWGMVYPENFKGSDFLSLNMGQPLPQDVLVLDTWTEKKVVENGVDIRGYDPEINFVKNGTLIEGEFQDPKYWFHKLEDIQKWLRISPISVPNDLCVVGIRGGEYSLYKDLFLPKEYFEKGMAKMRQINPNMRFEIHTDDPELAKQMFPNIPVVDNQQLSHSAHSNMGLNWRTMRCAKYAIIANSSFYILPRILQHHENKDAVTIAPRYWARHNSRVWALPQNYYKQFSYIHAGDTN